MTFVLRSLNQRGHSNLLIFGANSKNRDIPASLSALHNELDYRNAARRINTGDERSTSHRNFVSFGLVTRGITALTFKMLNGAIDKFCFALKISEGAKTIQTWMATATYVHKQFLRSPLAHLKD